MTERERWVLNLDEGISSALHVEGEERTTTGYIDFENQETDERTERQRDTVPLCGVCEYRQVWIGVKRRRVTSPFRLFSLIATL